MATLDQFKKLGKLHKKATEEKDPKRAAKLREEVDGKRSKLNAVKPKRGKAKAVKAKK